MGRRGLLVGVLLWWGRLLVRVLVRCDGLLAVLRVARGATRATTVVLVPLGRPDNQENDQADDSEANDTDDRPDEHCFVVGLLLFGSR